MSAYSKRVTQYFTVFLSTEDDSLVGIEVKGLKFIRKAVERLDHDVDIVKPLPVKDKDGEYFDFGVIVRQALVPEPDEPVRSQQRDEIDKAIKGIRIDKSKLCPS